MKNLLLALLLLTAPAAFSNNHPNGDSLAWLKGHWSGTGFQTDTNSHWTMTLDADPDTGKFEVKYPSLDCGGKWDLIDFNNYLARFTEKITHNTSHCMDGGNCVVTRIDENTITFTWFVGKTPMASAFLVKD